MTNSLLGYGSYVPQWRVDPRGTGKATRVVASFDEDSVTMAVAAAQQAVESQQADESLKASQPMIDRLVFVSGTPPYADKTNAATVHAALGLNRYVGADDAIGSARSAMAAVRAGFDGAPTLAVGADVRTGRPGSADERSGSDVAAALVFGPATASSPALAERVFGTSITEEFLDRWREPNALYGSTWEERFGKSRYTPLINDAVERTLSGAGLSAVDHVVVSSANSAVVKAAKGFIQGTVSTVVPPTGFSGAVDPMIGLIDVLDRAEADQTILVISAADGVDTLLMRTTDALVARRPRTALATAVAAPGRTVPYPTYLSWRGLLDVEPPRRPEPDRPAGPPSAREAGWKFGLMGSRCTACEFVHLPPMRVCRRCGTLDQMADEPVSARKGRVATFTVDRLAYSPSPPVVDVVIDFEGGGRTTLEVADARPEDLTVGAPVTLTFRKLFTADGVHNYFWKARQEAPSAEEAR